MFENFSAGLSKMHFTCPESRKTFKDFVQESFFYLVSSDIFGEFFGATGKTFSKKKCQKNIQRDLRSSSIIFFAEIVFQFFVALRAESFGPFAENFLPGCENCIFFVKGNF